MKGDELAVERVGAVVVPETKVVSIHARSRLFGLGRPRRWIWRLLGNMIEMLTGWMQSKREIRCQSWFERSRIGLFSMLPRGLVSPEE